MHPQEVERNVEMSLDDTSTNPDINVPLDITENPMKWDGNNARILGLLHETWLYYERNGLFDAFIQKRAKVLSNGKICCETVNHVPFVMGVIKEEDRTLANMCPPGDERIAQVNAYRAALTPPESPVHATGDVLIFGCASRPPPSARLPLKSVNP